MNCGFYECEITPALGGNMPGYFHERHTRKVMDKLYVRAMVAGEGEDRIAIASTDCIGHQPEYVTRIREKVAKRSSIRPDHVMVCATHTHTGGPVFDHGEGDAFSPAYVDFLVERVADCIVLADQRAEPTGASLAEGELDGYSFCRIYRMKDSGLRTNPGRNPDVIAPYKEIDKGVTAVYFTHGERLVAVLVGFTCHCDVVSSEVANSADFPGQLSAHIKQRFGEDVVVMFLQGACGNINHVDPFHPEVTNHPRRHIEIGDALAEEVIAMMAKAKPFSEETAARTETVDIPLRLPTEKELTWARDVMTTVQEDKERLSHWDRDQVNYYFAKQAAKCLAHASKSVSAEVQAMRLGDLILYASPSELFSEYADRLKAASPFAHTLVVGYANGYIGYVVVPECAVEGVYEYRLTDGRSPDVGAGEMMNQALMELGESLRG